MSVLVMVYPAQAGVFSGSQSHRVVYLSTADHDPTLHPLARRLPCGNLLLNLLTLEIAP